MVSFDKKLIDTSLSQWVQNCSKEDADVPEATARLKETVKNILKEKDEGLTNYLLESVHTRSYEVLSNDPNPTVEKMKTVKSLLDLLVPVDKEGVIIKDQQDLSHKIEETTVDGLVRKVQDLSKTERFRQNRYLLVVRSIQSGSYPIAKKALKRMNQKEKIEILLYFIAIGTVDAVRFLLKDKVNVNGEGGEQKSPLLLAVQRGDRLIVELLLENKANPNPPKSKWLSPLHQAILLKAVDLIQLLVKGGANLEELNQFGLTPLLVAMNTGRYDVAKLLVKLGANPMCENHMGETPLSMAILLGDRELINLIKEKTEAYPELYSLGGFQLACVAAFRGEEDIIQMYQPSFDKGPPKVPMQMRPVNTGTVIPLFTQILNLSYTHISIWKKVEKVFAHIHPELTILFKEVFHRKELAHAFHLGGTTTVSLAWGETRFPLEGLFAAGVIDLLRKSTLKTQKEVGVDYEVLISGLTAGIESSDEELVAKIKNGDPVFMSVGFEAHVTVHFIWKNHYFICDGSGVGSLENKLITAFLFDPEKMDVNLVQNIRSFANKSREEYQVFTTQTLPDALSFEVDILSLYVERNHPLRKQTVGNCSWASNEVAAFVFFALSSEELDGKNGYGNFSELIQPQISKFSTWLLHQKLFVLESYLKKHESGNLPLGPDLFLVKEAILQSFQLVGWDETSSEKLSQLEKTFLSLLSPEQNTMYLTEKLAHHIPAIVYRKL